jgi:hypothetical protein
MPTPPKTWRAPKNGNHATIYTVGPTAEEADAKLMGALGELKLMPDMSKKPNA